MSHSLSIDDFMGLINGDPICIEHPEQCINADGSMYLVLGLAARAAMQSRLRNDKELKQINYEDCNSHAKSRISSTNYAKRSHRATVVLKLAISWLSPRRCWSDK